MILDLNDIANEHGLHRHIQFGTQLEEGNLNLGYLLPHWF